MNEYNEWIHNDVGEVIDHMYKTTTINSGNCQWIDFDFGHDMVYDDDSYRN